MMLASAAHPATHSGLAERLVALAFDPAWNLEHRFVIFGAIVGVLFLSGVGLPLPEDIPLTLAGFTTIKQAGDRFVPAHYLLAFALVVIPILLGDLVTYSLGRRFGLDLRERVGFVRRLLSPARLARVPAWFDRYGAFAIFLGRQVAGVRFVTFFIAGTMRVPLQSFLAFDFLGCVVSVPIWLSLGALASRYGEGWLRAAMSRASHTILFVALVFIFALAVITKLRNGRAAAGADQPGDVP